MHDIRVGLFNLIKKHNRIRPASHGFRKLSALFIADVTWRRTDQPRSSEFFHVLRHVDLNNASASPNMNSARVRARYVLPTPVGPRKTNDPIGRFGSFKSARERRKALLMAVTASS